MEIVRDELSTTGGDDADRDAAYTLAAEVRAVEEGHHARVLPDGSILVKAESGAGDYRVVIRRTDRGVIVFGCTCPSGAYRTYLPVPCKHAALAGRRLEREGLARWWDGVWHVRARAALRAALASRQGGRSTAHDRDPRPRGAAPGEDQAA